MVTHQLQVERRTGKVRRPETDVLPLFHATNRVVVVVNASLCFVVTLLIKVLNNLLASAISRLFKIFINCIGLLTFVSQELDCTYPIHVFIHTYTENKTELGLL